MENICLICGFNELYDPPYDEKGGASDEICPCCGFHFGFDDDDVQDKKVVYEQWRGKWLQNGSQWFSKSRKPNENWNVEQQLNKINNL
ncbi:hypothetical protein MHH81_08785 [Psychrobacillus sp. FSL H8-0484]|uniref:hypothetical protein n=1 Tax=Psychrobacillus sp. FSL H8-0484 TaxID=2921390 RepID=UPI0030F9A75F